MFTPAPYLISAMRPVDIDGVMAIERCSFPMPWSRSVFVEELTREQARVDVVLRRLDEAVVAFINYWLVVDELHVLNVATHPAERRRGHARRLLDHVLKLAVEAGCRLATLEVRRSNEAAIGLYRGLGFRSVGMRPQYYADNQEDALIMNRELAR